MADDDLDPEAILQQLELDTSTPPHKRGSTFRRIAEHHKANGDESAADRMATLAHVFSGVVAVGPGRFSNDKPRFMPQFQWSDGSWSPVFEVMTCERWGHVREFRDGSGNPLQRARLSDFMWDGLKDHESARDAIAAYLSIARPTADSGLDGRTAVDAAVRALDLSVLINDTGARTAALEACLALLRQLATLGQSKWDADLARELLASPKDVRALLDLSEFASICEGAIKACVPGPARDFEREWLDLLKRVHELRGDQDACRDCRARFAASYEAEGDFWANEARFMLNASAYYEKAVEAWKRVGGCEDAVARVINKLAAATRESHKEMRTVETSVTIPAEEMEAWKAGVLDLFAQHGIAILACRDYVLPDLDSIEQSVRQTHGSVLLQSLVQRTAVQDDRLVGRTAGPEGNVAADVQSQFIWGLRYYSLQIARWVFDAVVCREGSVPQEIIGFVKACPLIAEWRHDLLSHALDAYARSDYIASVHILAFQLEGIVRDLATEAGLPRLVYRDGLTQLRYLPNLLRDDALVQMLGRRLTVALAAVLVEQTGLNVRNLVGHGEAQLDFFSRDVNEILIILLLVLAAFRKQAIAEGETKPHEEGGG